MWRDKNQTKPNQKIKIKKSPWIFVEKNHSVFDTCSILCVNFFGRRAKRFVFLQETTFETPNSG